MKRYKVLWLEDEINLVEAFFDIADMENVELDHVESVNELKAKLNGKNIINYDAAILDAKGVIESLEEIPSLNAVHKANSYIDGLSGIKVLPKFILSAQLEGDENRNIREMLGEENIFIKTKDEDKIIAKLKEEADKQIETQIRHEHYFLFNVLRNYDDDVQKMFMQILLGVKKGIDGLDDELYFTQLRIVLEHVFRKANEFGLLHDNCVQKGNNQVNLTDASLFLAGEDTKYSGVRCQISHFPKIIAENVKNIIFTTGAASHTTVVDITKNIDVQEYRKTVKSPYLLYSLAYQVMDVILWFDSYCESNTDVAKNKSLWENIEFTAEGQKYEKGIITRISKSGWGTVNLDSGGKTAGVYKGIMNELKIEEGDQIKFTIEEKIHTENIEKL